MSLESVAIVPFAPEHFEGFRSCMDAVARERRWLAFLEAPPVEESRRYTEMMLAQRYPFLLALDEGKVVGWCDIGGGGRPTYAHVGILGIGLLPPYRDRGLGRRLMSATIEAGRAFGFERIELRVHARNERGRKLYENLGFQLEGTARKAFKADGAYDDVHLMGLVFEESSSLA
jgi:RimJ/RimL family protein N-acetyltransferase